MKVFLLLGEEDVTAEEESVLLDSRTRSQFGTAFITLFTSVQSDFSRLEENSRSSLVTVAETRPEPGGGTACRSHAMSFHLFSNLQDCCMQGDAGAQQGRHSARLPAPPVRLQRRERVGAGDAAGGLQGGDRVRDGDRGGLPPGCGLAARAGGGGVPGRGGTRTLRHQPPPHRHLQVARQLVLSCIQCSAARAAAG